MTETDDVLDALRRARPDGLPDEQVSAHTTAAQALLEDIVSRPAASRTRVDRTLVPAPPRGRYRRPALVAAAATVVAGALVGSLLSVGTTEPSAGATLDAATTRTSQLVERSGRAVQQYRFGARPPGDEWTIEFEFSGDDGTVTQPNGDIFRVIDGVGYTYEQVPPNGRREWRRLPGTYAFWRYADGESGAFGVDPLTLLDALSSAGDFEVVGNEDVDGIPTRQLRAGDADAALDVGRLRHGVEGTATSLDVWVDPDDVVRRIDFRIEDAFGLQGIPWQASIRFFDLGDPITIEAPGDVPEWVPPPDTQD
jgi:hypothetical protein